MWTTTADAVTNVRELLADSNDDKYGYRKKVLGIPDGTNVTFKTFERRRVTDLTTATAPQGVFVNGSPVVCVTDDTATGEFTLDAAPNNGDMVEATYYYHWFLDDELQSFLTNACQWLGLGTNYINIPDGLIPAAIHYAGQDAYHRLAQWQSISEGVAYRMEDTPDTKTNSTVQNWISLAEHFKTKAIELRDNYYTRQGQTLAPNFVSLAGHIRDPQPKR
jgi:hypothetical protein